MTRSSQAYSSKRILVVGGGSIGTRHLANLQRLGMADLAMVEVSSDRRAELSGRSDVTMFADYESGLRWRPEAVLICTPTSLHLDQANRAAENGCHLFVEKPISHRWDGVVDCLSYIGQQGLQTLIGCNFRFHPGMQLAKDLLDQGGFGRIVSARAWFGQYLPDWHPWEDYRRGYSARRELGGGVILDRIHEIDYLMWLLGDIVEVYAMAEKLSHLESDTEDSAALLLRFKSGALGEVHLDYVRRRYDCGFELVGDEGTIRWSYPESALSWYRAETGVWQRKHWPAFDSNQPYMIEMEHFLSILNGDEESAQSAQEGAGRLAVALACIESAQSRRPIIPLRP
jgi:predicted dehydrogenase